jgi:predicted PurR-regulated permease PerM
MLNLIFSLFNRYFMLIIILGAIMTFLGSALLMWQHSIKQEAQLEFNNQQLQKVVEQQKKFMEDMSQLNNDQKVILDDLTNKNNQLHDQLSNLEGYLSSDQANKDSRPSSAVLKNTIQKLGGQ